MAENFVAEAFSLLAIGLVIIALRLYSRIITVGFRRLAADDYLMVLAGVSPHLSNVLAKARSNPVDSACTPQRLSQLMSWELIGMDSPTIA